MNFLRLWRSTQRSGPWLAAGIAATIAVAMPQLPASTELTVARHLRIASTLQAVPMIVEDWIGEDRPLIPAAQELLRPNAALSRVWRRLGSNESVALSLIHCSDVRDMGSHYPPVCYPANGWSLIELDSDANSRVVPLEVEEGDLRLVRVYRFSRTGADLSDLRTTVFNAFILPSGEWIHELGEVQDAGGKRRLAKEGVAQVQLMVAGWPDAGEARHLCESLLRALPPSVFDVLGSTPDDPEHDDE